MRSSRDYDCMYAVPVVNEVTPYSCVRTRLSITQHPSLSAFLVRRFAARANFWSMERTRHYGIGEGIPDPSHVTAASLHH
jgi:hypothetical protein